MKYAPAVAGVLLGLLFVMSAVVVLFNLVETPKIPEGTPMAMFMGAFGPTGYMTFIKVLELVVGILLMIPALGISACSCSVRSSSTFSRFTSSL